MDRKGKAKVSQRGKMAWTKEREPENTRQTPGKLKIGEIQPKPVYVSAQQERLPEGTWESGFRGPWISL